MTQHTPDSIRQMIDATLDRLNKDGACIASLSDAVIQLRKVQEAKVAEAFRGLFVSMTLPELALAASVLDGMLPRPATASMTPIPAPASVPTNKPQKKSRK